MKSIADELIDFYVHKAGSEERLREAGLDTMTHDLCQAEHIIRNAITEARSQVTTVTCVAIESQRRGQETAEAADEHG